MVGVRDRGARLLAVAAVGATMVVGAYAMVAYAPARTPRVVAALGTERGEGATDAVEVVGIRPAVLRRLRARATTDTAWASAVRVAVEQPGTTAAVPRMIGRYAVLGDRIRFEPRFPFASGVTYRVDVDARRLAEIAGLDPAEGDPHRLTHRFAVPVAVVPRTTRVVAVHPAVDRVPSNMLRWYIEFSAPIEPGTSHEHIRLLDEAGQPVDGAFLRVDEELWDPQRRRLTIFFDPGRVKRGVRANLEMGRPIVAGRRYRLVVDAALHDARGAPLASGFEKEFDVGPSDGTSPDPTAWQLAVPRAGTRESLSVSFGEPLDHALASRMVSVEAGDRKLPGRVELPPGDSIWTFTPTSPWLPGTYTLSVDAALEDLTGNSVVRVFDAERRVGEPGGGAPTGKRPRKVEFRVR